MLNSTLTRDYCCAICHSALVEKVINGAWRVVCSQDPAHQGYVKKTVAWQQDLQRRYQAHEAQRRAQPERSAQADIEELWGT